MTSDYVSSAIQVIVEIQNAATNKSVQSLTLITSIGVISGLVAYLSRDAFPKITAVGVEYLAGLMAITLLVNTVVKHIQANTRRKLSFVERDEKL